MAADRWIRRVAKPIVFAAALLPVTFLIWHAFHGELGANPLERITHDTGDWTLRFIVMTLAITPVRRLTGQNWLIRFRRMIGLFAFFFPNLSDTAALRAENAAIGLDVFLRQLAWPLPHPAWAFFVYLPWIVWAVDRWFSRRIDR